MLYIIYIYITYIDICLICFDFSVHDPFKGQQGIENGHLKLTVHIQLN